MASNQDLEDKERKKARKVISKKHTSRINTSFSNSHSVKSEDQDEPPEPKIYIYPYLRGQQIAAYIQKNLVKGDQAHYNRMLFGQFFFKQLLKNKEIQQYFEPQETQESGKKVKKQFKFEKYTKKIQKLCLYT